ncbi:hypothetical protein VTO73DRAFT_3034 [Trametes versicolor]
MAPINETAALTPPTQHCPCRSPRPRLQSLGLLILHTPFSLSQHPLARHPARRSIECCCLTLPLFFPP